MAFIDDDVVPWNFTELRPVILVHQVLVCCYQHIELLVLNLISESTIPYKNQYKHHRATLLATSETIDTNL